MLWPFPGCSGAVSHCASDGGDDKGRKAPPGRSRAAPAEGPPGAGVRHTRPPHAPHAPARYSGFCADDCSRAAAPWRCGAACLWQWRRRACSECCLGSQGGLRADYCASQAQLARGATPLALMLRASERDLAPLTPSHLLLLLLTGRGTESPGACSMGSRAPAARRRVHPALFPSTLHPRP